jgi:hypothetical protein
MGLGDPVGFENLEEGRVSQRKLASLSPDAAGFGKGPAIARNASLVAICLRCVAATKPVCQVLSPMQRPSAWKVGRPTNGHLAASANEISCLISTSCGW